MSQLFTITLGIVYRNQGDFQQAKNSHARALDIRRKQLGPDHVDVATSFNNLGIVFKNVFYFQQAKDSYARSLDIYVNQFGLDHVNVGTWVLYTEIKMISRKQRTAMHVNWSFV